LSDSLSVSVAENGPTPATADSAGEPVSVRVRIATLVVVLLPFAGLVTAAILLWGYGLRWGELALMAGMYVAVGVGVTVGFHRLFTHRSFETNRVVQCLLAVLGSMAVQGPLLKWVAVHRRHHQYSDRDGDPHSPHRYGSGVFAMLRGLFHAHVGWIFERDSRDLAGYVKDLRQRPLMRWLSNLFPVWVLLGLLIPALLGWLVMGGWYGMLLGFLWGGLVRILLGQHVTWSVNSICHFWGRQEFTGSDQSRNNFICGVLALGEGWHNNHHAFPTSARHGLRWWQIDVSYYVIRILVFLKLAWNVRVPSQRSLVAGTS
jgi:stearoyl-CoA desaturase (Delta-9 desaturase)